MLAGHWEMHRSQRDFRRHVEQLETTLGPYFAISSNKNHNLLRLSRNYSPN